MDNELSTEAIEILLNNSDWEVRVKLAKEGYGLDQLIYDPDWRVRQEVAKRGYGLNKLINDPHWYVRAQVAEKSRRLDILTYGTNKVLRIMAIDFDGNGNSNLYF